jgi:hypothetical protein
MGNESNKITAVEWLWEQIDEILPFSVDTEIGIKLYNAKEQAKQMEKEQHKETFKQSRQAKIFEKDMPPVWESWEQYYNEHTEVTNDTTNI